MKNLYLIAVCSLLLISCNKMDNAETIVVGGRYSIDIPKSYTTTKDLNQDASLQYNDAKRELYVIVIDEPKEAITKALVENGLENTYTPDLKGYSQLIVDNMTPKVQADTLSPFTDITIGGLKGRASGIQGVVQGHHIYWKMAFVEGKSRYYQIMLWTLADRRKKHEAEMQSIIDSFKETDRSVSK